MSVRILGALGITLAAVTGGAQASSLVFPGVPSSTPSIIKLGVAKPLKTADATKAGDMRSVVALGEAQPDVTYEKVAAIPDKPGTRHGFQQGPVVIRGGVAGPAFSAPAPSAAPATGTAPAAGTVPATATASAAPSGDTGNKSAAAPSTPAQAAAQPMQGIGKAK
ncbi:hypothetical protein [Mesorhizobium sp. Mes31]|uniref:hypothetical protein n=1 Tax=Mesorhizobium sp. Mes31 TaxID=2926017 RepID=UPI0021195347|nr:hypothetical protein [Mesorhizobium sp. Mes31]